MSRIKVLGYPYSDLSSASARLRFHHRLASIKDLIDLKVFSEGDKPSDYDVVYIQKRVNVDTIYLTAKAKACNKPIIFDIDDAIGTAADVSLDLGMMDEATIVTTDTRFKKEAYQYKIKNPMVVIPDGLDYFTEWTEHIPFDGVQSVCTFGWDHNLMAAKIYLENVVDYFSQVGYIGNKALDCFSEKGLIFHSWGINTFIDTLRRYDCSILAHGDGPIDTMRCDNRFLSAAFAGLLPLIKDSREYRETAELLEVPFLCIRDPGDTVSMIREFSPQRSGILEGLRKRIWDNFQPRKQGILLYNVFNEVINA